MMHYLFLGISVVFMFWWIIDSYAPLWFLPASVTSWLIGLLFEPRGGDGDGTV